MTRWAARPLWVAGLVFLAVCLIAVWIPLSAVRWMLYGSTVLLIPTLTVPFLRRLRVPTVFLLACSIASLSYVIVETNRYLPATQHVGKTVFLQAQVQPSTTDTVCLRVQDGDLPENVGVLLYHNKFETTYEPYEVISARFELIPFKGQGLSRLQRKASSIWFAAKLIDEQPIRQAGTVPWSDRFYRLRCAAVADIEQKLPKDSAAVVSGICFGEDSKLSETAQDDFRTCGVTHLFAVSGLHMTVLAQVVLSLLKKCRVPRVWQAIIALSVLLSFMMIVGLSASVVRAGVLCALVLVGNCLHRQADSRTSLGMALLLLLTINPYAAYDVGLLLSFASTYGLLVWARPLQDLLLRIPYAWMGSVVAGIWKAVAIGIAMTLAASFATIPVLTVYFGTLSLVSVPANVLTMFPAEWIMLLGCFASLVSPVFPFLGNLLLFVCGKLAEYMLWICGVIAKFPFATITVRATLWIAWIAATYFLLLMGWVLYRKRGVLGGAVVAVLILGVISALNRSVMKGRLTVESISCTTDTAACVYFERYTVAVLSLSSTEPVDEIITRLAERDITHVDAVIFIGGKGSAVAAAPAAFGDCLDGNTVCVYADVETPFIGIDLSQRAARFGENGSLISQNGFLQMTVGDNCVVFAENGAKRQNLPIAFEDAALLFSAGKAEVLCSDKAQGLPEGTVLTDPPSALVLKKGEVWYSS